MVKNPQTILVIEDEEDLNDVYQLILKRAGYKVETALNGKEALDSLKSFEPDLILLDLRMPVMDGNEFLQKYDLSKHKGTKVIVFSNYDMQKEIDEAYKLGAHRYIVKALASPRELIKIVKDTLVST